MSRAMTATTHEQLATLQDRFAAMIATHRAVVELDDRGEHAAAVERSLDEELPALRSLDEGLLIETADAQRRFDDQIADADDGLGVLEVAIPLLVLASAALALFGLQRRIAEYR